MRRALTRSAVASAFMRSFLIQGSWNYHTMLGSGFAFSMLPALKSLYGSEPDAMDAAVQRHLEHFNAHPYLAGVALGAALKLEAEGADPELVRRFKLAVRGPLGSLGDGLVWAAWLPGASVLALALYWMGLPGWWAAAVFLVVYNVGHIGLRFWGFRVGLSEGQLVGRRLERANLARWTERLKGGVALLVGLLVGALLAGDGGLAASGVLWTVLAACAFLAGLIIGHRAWRPAAVTVVAAITILAAVGALG
ncbi:MAG: PTS system mannose/fructose/sorbose family transporter subunit IID [Gemmatimonadota bacterium]|nr:PTS system mannose/fructose/sorbose family transporter subunit IID [Gemmatimonadota bacterium]MDH3422461.1 PTS system mannose/fructose/sorbose family transporter subunit IID [Gemmatimonadota bacterium]